MIIRLTGKHINLGSVGTEMIAAIWPEQGQHQWDAQDGSEERREIRPCNPCGSIGKSVSPPARNYCSTSIHRSKC